MFILHPFNLPLNVTDLRDICQSMRNLQWFHKYDGQHYQFTLNIAEESSRSSKAERKRYFEIARGSVIEIDTAFDIAKELGYFSSYQIHKLEKYTLDCYRLLSALIKSVR